MTTEQVSILSTIVAGILIGLSYIIGYWRAENRYKEMLQRHIEEVERLSDSEWKLRIDIDNTLRKGKEWMNKYYALQQEIECHIHEVHEEVERPHVEKTWPIDKSSYIHKGYREWVEEHDEDFMNGIYGNPLDK